MPSSAVTTNNLTEHLQWFLRDRPFIPPPFQVPDTSVRCSSRTAVGGILSIEADDNAVSSSEQSNSAAASPKVDPDPSSHPVARQDPIEIHINQLSVEEECPLVHSSLYPNDHDMARLRSTPSSPTKRMALTTTVDHAQLTPCKFESPLNHNRRAALNSISG
jgi:hypothetical protein